MAQRRAFSPAMPPRGVLLGAVLVAAQLVWLPVVCAQETADLPAMALAWARKNAPAAMPPSPSPLRVEVSVGLLDSRLKLAACGTVEPYLPVGARLWGRSRVGLRCVDGMTRWNVSVPVLVKAFGPAWVLKTQVQPGAVLDLHDATQAEVDWAEETNAVLADAAGWVGQTASHLLNPGQALRQGMAKPAQVFQAGAQIRVIAQGAGFQVSGDAQAMSAGVVGQQARVRMDNGRVATGTVLDVRTVKIDL